MAVPERREADARLRDAVRGQPPRTLPAHPRPAAHPARGAWVVNVTSGAHRFSTIRRDDAHFDSGDYTHELAYAQSKNADVLCAVELDRRWAEDGIRGYPAHPGVVVGTALNSAAGTDGLRAAGLVDDDGRPVIDPVAGKKTVQQGAATIVSGAVGPPLAGIGGVYLKDCDVAPLDDEHRPLTADSLPADAASHSLDPQNALRLWELSERLLQP